MYFKSDISMCMNLLGHIPDEIGPYFDKNLEESESDHYNSSYET